MTSYRPNPKVMAGAGATLLAWGAQAGLGIDVPPGIEGAFAVTIAYFFPSTGRRPDDDILVPDPPGP